MINILNTNICIAAKSPERGSESEYYSFMKSPPEKKKINKFNYMLYENRKSNNSTQ